jgi:hypothetical protein
MTPTGVIRVTVKDRAGNVGTADAAQLLVDSIAPNGRVTSPAITASQEVDLAVDVKDAGPAGLSSTQLWYSGDDGQSWAEGPQITEGFKRLPWKAPRDGKYRLALVSIDMAGNPSPTPKAKGDDQFTVLIDTVKPVVQLGSAIGVTHSGEKGDPRKFKPGDRVQVQFTVKEINPAANPVAIYLQNDPEKGWVELGKDLPADAAFRFEIPQPKGKRTEARIRVVASDVAGNIGEVVAPEGFLILDADVESGPNGLDGLDEGPGK